jgi:hypothetical protein
MYSQDKKKRYKWIKNIQNKYKQNNRNKTKIKKFILKKKIKIVWLYKNLNRLVNNYNVNKMSKKFKIIKVPKI